MSKKMSISVILTSGRRKLRGLAMMLSLPESSSNTVNRCMFSAWLGR